MYLRIRRRIQDNDVWTSFHAWRSNAVVLEISGPQLDTVLPEYNQLMTHEQGDYLNLGKPEIQRAFNNFWQTALDKFKPCATIEV